MTTIERSRFVADLSASRIPVRDVSASLAGSGMGSVEIDALAGPDQVFNTPEEYGQLFDRLVALESEQRAAGVTGDLDRARAVYARFTSVDRPLIPPADPSARPRTTGIAAPSVLIPEPVGRISDSAYVRAFGRMHAAQLRAGADRNVLGPEAAGRRRLLGETDRVSTRIAALEREADALPVGSPLRESISRQIEAEVHLFEGTVASERAFVAAQVRELAAISSSPGRDLLRRLPPYIRESVEREGIVIPGLPGALQISPSGGRWGLKF